jgi:hypothetical protein
MTEDEKSKQAKGGAARARGMTAKERSDSARRAALSKWAQAGVIPLAKYGAADRPLRIGDIEIPCYVLADARRVLATVGLQTGIGLSTGGGTLGSRRLTQLMMYLERKGIDTKGLIARVDNPITFIPPHGGIPARGYEATILPDICAVLIEAGQRDVLMAQQRHLAERAAILQHGFATVGIVALVDEATGYQDARVRDALAKILEKFVAKELRPWVRTFPAEFYRQIHRLNGWEYSEDGGSPGVVGHWTTNIVYKRLAPGVWEELDRLTPRTDGGRLKNRLFQRLTEDVGHPRLREHLAAVVMLMKYSPDWQEFMHRIDIEFPQWGKTLMLPFPDNYHAPPAKSGRAR